QANTLLPFGLSSSLPGKKYRLDDTEAQLINSELCPRGGLALKLHLASEQSVPELHEWP
ncbi:hypothetical protein V6N12_055299, partial [Hibiscus sabdariffa]